MAELAAVLSIVAALSYYVLFLVGSVSLGYLIVRLSYPEVRTFSNQKKLGQSATLGAAIVFAAVVVEYLPGMLGIADFSGFLPTIVVVFSFITFAGLQLFFHFSASQYLTIGIPVAVAAAAPARKIPQPTETIAPAKKTAATPQPFLAREEKSERKELPPAPGKSRQPGQRPEAVKAVEKERTAEIVAVPARKEVAAETGKPPEKQGRPFDLPWLSMPKVQPRPAEPLKTEPVKAEPAKLEPAKPAIPEAPEKISEMPEKPQEAEIERPRELADLKKEVEKQIDWSEFQIPVKKKEAPASAEPVEPAKTGQAGEKPLEKTLAEKIEVQVRPVGEPELPRVEEAKRETMQEVEKVREKEWELVLRDIAPKAFEELEEGDSHRRRRYMEAPAATSEERRVRVIAGEDVAARDEFGMLMQDVYSQLKESKTDGGLGEDLGVKEPRKEKAGEELTLEEIIGEKKKAEKPGGQSSELFAQLNAMASGKKLPARQEAPAKESDVEFVKIKAEKGMGCPTCHSKNTKIVFCPYCGTGMCANCSPKIFVEGDHFTYVCPKCKENVTVRKKTAAPAPA